MLSIPTTTQKLAKNVSNTVKITGSAVSTGLTIFTNPFVWVGLIIIFFPFTVVNYLSLYFVNLWIAFFNLIIFLLNVAIEFIWGAIVAVLNMFITFLNGLDYTIELPGGLPDIVIDPFNFSLISPPGPNSISYIPYKTLSQIEWVDNDNFFLRWALEQVGLL